MISMLDMGIKGWLVCLVGWLVGFFWGGGGGGGGGGCFCFVLFFN